jgi:histidinol-phosphate aminotransferase
LAVLRIEKALCPEWIVHNIRRVQNPFEVNMAGHITAIMTLNNLKIVQNNVRSIINERVLLYKLLSQQPNLAPIPSEGNFILTHLRKETVTMEKYVQPLSHMVFSCATYILHPRVTPCETLSDSHN